jgi:hypothetical protein
MVRTEPPGNRTVPVYAADAHVAWCLQFYLDEARESRFRIVTAGEPAGERFWLAYREMQPGAGQPRLDRLTADGYHIDAGSRSATAWQTASLVPVRRVSDGEEADNITERRP